VDECQKTLPDTKHLLITTSTLPKIAVEALMDRTSAEEPRGRVDENEHSTEMGARRTDLPSE
jgi:hypothetical protein